MFSNTSGGDVFFVKVWAAGRGTGHEAGAAEIEPVGAGATRLARAVETTAESGTRAGILPQVRDAAVLAAAGGPALRTRAQTLSRRLRLGQRTHPVRRSEFRRVVVDAELLDDVRHRSTPPESRESAVGASDRRVGSERPRSSGRSVGRACVAFMGDSGRTFQSEYVSPGTFPMETTFDRPSGMSTHNSCERQLRVSIIIHELLTIVRASGRATGGR